jgi:hypothetical protein
MDLHHRYSKQAACRRRQTAFTTIEVLIVIAVISVLIGFILIAVRGAKAKGSELVSIANLRSIYAVVFIYSESSKGMFPAIVSDRQYPAGCENILTKYGPWEMRTAWPVTILDRLPWRENASVYLSPGSSRLIDAKASAIGTCGWPSSFEYSLSFVARPELWSGNVPSDTSPDSFIAPVYQHEALFPSNKTLLWDRDCAWVHRELRHKGVDIDEAVPMIFVDGHATLKTPSQATAPLQTGMGLLTEDARLHNTPFGVRGRDY